VDEKNKHRERNNTGRGKVTRRTNTDGEKELGGGERETIQRKKNRARKQRKNKQKRTQHRKKNRARKQRKNKQKRTQHRKKNRARKQRKKQAEKEEPPERTGIIITFVPSSLKKKTRSREEMNEA
jgi:hypothetical protein